MKKLFPLLLIAMLMFSFILLQINAGTKTVVDSGKAIEPAEAKAIFPRLNGINAMDKSGLTFSEKSVSPIEVRESQEKEKMQHMSVGVYLTLGAIIILLILLIIRI